MKPQNRALRVFTYYKVDSSLQEQALRASQKILAVMSLRCPLRTDLLVRADQTGPQVTVMEVLYLPESVAEKENELLKLYQESACEQFGAMSPPPVRHVELFIDPEIGAC